MRFALNEERCRQMGLNGKSQIRVPYVHKNLWWSLNGGETAFGYGDLDQADLARILDWVCHPSQEGLVFTAWNEHHETPQQQMNVPMLRITLRDGITYPYRIQMEQRRAAMRVVS